MTGAPFTDQPNLIGEESSIISGVFGVQDGNAIEENDADAATASISSTIPETDSVTEDGDVATAKREALAVVVEPIDQTLEQEAVYEDEDVEVNESVDQVEKEEEKEEKEEEKEVEGKEDEAEEFIGFNYNLRSIKFTTGTFQ